MPEPQPFSMYSPASEPAGRTLLLLGEAPGEEEVREGKPFVGPSGQLLNSLLAMAGLARSQFHALNVFSQRPPGNDLKLWTMTKTELKKAGFSEADCPPKLQNRYLHPAHEPELERLANELQQLKPDLILAIGGTALWYLTGDSRITLHRGAFFTPVHNYMQAWSCTALATFHPAAVLREWSMRPIVWADLLKAQRWLSNTLTPPQPRRIWINPTEEELQHVYERFAGVPNDLLGVDIETSPRCGQITSFAIGTAAECICIPLWNPQTLPELCHSHATASAEATAWWWIRRFCELPNPKAGQNFLYDYQWLMDAMDVRVVNLLHDTSIMQHSLQPELPKDLGTLGSLYLNEPAWKFMRTTKEEAKADE